jgi:hypothetical protein
MVIKFTDTAPALKIYTKPGQMWPIATCVQQKRSKVPVVSFGSQSGGCRTSGVTLPVFVSRGFGVARVFFNFKAALECLLPIPPT